MTLADPKMFQTRLPACPTIDASYAEGLLAGAGLLLLALLSGLTGPTSAYAYQDDDDDNETPPGDGVKVLPVRP